MINRRISDNPVATGSVTGTAKIRCCDMAQPFSARNNPVMTIEADFAANLRGGVCELSRRPCGGAVTQAALLGCNEMLRGFLAGVTTRTCADHLRMIDTLYNPRSTDRMAKLALVRRRNMQHRLAGRRCAIVATQTIVFNVPVVKTCAGKRSDAMAQAAVRRSFDVTGGFADCKSAVVADAASDGHRTVIHPCALLKRQQRAVTTVARRRGGNMVLRLTACNNAIMTTRALLGGAAKYAVHMAGFAGDVFMPPCERESSREMVEIET